MARIIKYATEKVLCKWSSYPNGYSSDWLKETSFRIQILGIVYLVTTGGGSRSNDPLVYTDHKVTVAIAEQQSAIWYIDNTVD